MGEDNTLTTIIGSYGVPYRGVIMNRVAAQHYVQEMLGSITTIDLFPSNQKFKIIACYLEDIDGPQKGTVVAVCRPLQGVGPMEYK